MTQLEAVLVGLARTAGSATVAPADLAARVLRVERRRRTRRRSALAGAVVVAGGLATAAAHGGSSRYREYTIPSGAMEPTIAIGDHLIFDARLKPVDGDVVVVWVTVDGTRSVVAKRVVASGGETVSCPAAAPGGPCVQLEVDGTAVSEEFLTGGPGNAFGPVHVPAGEVFLLGDHRDNSLDSREFGPVPASHVVGVGVSIATPGKTSRALPGAPSHPIPGGSDIEPAQLPPSAQAIPVG